MAPAAHPALARVPALPAAAVRDALRNDAWGEAERLLELHHAAIVLALSNVDLKTTPRQPWLDLLAAHGALMHDMREARDAASAALARCGQDRRGAQAWLRELA